MSEFLPTDDRSQRLEQIVAYLDGELSPEESAQVERRLASDEMFRQELQSMERAWLVLDELPQTTVDDNFSRTTMEMVVKAAGDEVKHMTEALPVQQRKRKLTKGLLALGAVLMGVLVGKLLWVDPNQELIDDLPSIQYIDVYSQVPSVEFLQELAGVLPADIAESSSDQTEDQRSQFLLVSSEDKRESWLDDLENQQRLTLRAKLNRFQAMSEQQQERIRKLHADIVGDANSQDLQQVLLLYQQWLQGLSSSQQYQLRELEPDERVRRIKKIIESEKRDRSLGLSEEELKRLYEGVQDERDAIMKHVMQRLSDENKPRELRNRSPLWQFFIALGRTTPELKDDLNRAILDSLPQEKREAYQELSPQEQWWHFFQWMSKAERDRNRAGARNRPKKPSDRELEKFFVDDVDPELYERLLAMPRDKMERVLEAMYRGDVPCNDCSTLEVLDERESRPFGPWRFDRRRGEGRRGDARRADGPPGTGERFGPRRDDQGPGPEEPGFGGERPPRERRGPRREGPPGDEGRFEPGPPFGDAPPPPPE